MLTKSKNDSIRQKSLHPHYSVYSPAMIPEKNISEFFEQFINTTQGADTFDCADGVIIYLNVNDELLRVTIEKL